jgi:transcriptional regulator with XRE-family HTH domain
MEARRVRAEEGASIKEIAARLGVSTSSVSLWVRDIELTDDQLARLALANPAVNRQRSGSARWSEVCRGRRREWQEEGRGRARAGDPLHHAGCMLFWAEGGGNRNNAILTNSDSDLLLVFRRFMRDCYEMPDERLAFSVNCFLGNGVRLEEIEAWWLAALDLPRASLRASTVDRPSSASRKRGRTLVYGTGRLAVASTAAVQSIYGAIQEYAGIDRPEWLS